MSGARRRAGGLGIDPAAKSEKSDLGATTIRCYWAKVYWPLQFAGDACGNARWFAITVAHNTEFPRKCGWGAAGVWRILPEGITLWQVNL